MNEISTDQESQDYHNGTLFEPATLSIGLVLYALFILIMTILLLPVFMLMIAWLYFFGD